MLFFADALTNAYFDLLLITWLRLFQAKPFL